MYSLPITNSLFLYLQLGNSSARLQFLFRFGKASLVKFGHCIVFPERVLATYRYGFFSLLFHTRAFHSKTHFEVLWHFHFRIEFSVGRCIFLHQRGEKNPTAESGVFGVTLHYAKPLCIITRFCLLRAQGACCLLPTRSHNPVGDVTLVSMATIVSRQIEDDDGVQVRPNRKYRWRT